MSKRGAALYLPTPVGVTVGLTPGQWVALSGHVKPGRFVRYNDDGTAYILPPVGKGKRARVSMAAFCLDRQKPLAVVASLRDVERTDKIQAVLNLLDC